ncbi:IclR family transcriptional regulator [Lutimaribacter sp. EGI FJ00015]|uniref:IclR family transcriptional regulator n=1 Tax=Lutimaribacter degradans TaxID=2945989 RepID=A0ACC5ZSQ3_9RHOB|nr:IclR family transcriptional regulator [Lutimaribacter sp. EGI FJ00013]MCM2561317.1 IclR family transcriptional regulator [Lutimaribacter sp. EGI FJ00013]MCO0611732.1 IclR family transcriptional regulator [Lutimaribacter sp. EGI FJ00015]MCO0635146.1 IclR family transcriptional regulator [Lutimaribacter sp. EGI FJ00014]
MARNTTRAEPGLRDLNEDQRADPLFVRSIERAMQVLSAFNHADQPMSLSQIAEAAGVDRSAAQRMVHTLRVLGYIERDDMGRGFVPGIRILDHTLDFLRLNHLVRRATPVLQELRKTVRERVDLSLFDDLRVVYAVRLQSKRQTFYTTLVGHSVPTFCSSGGWAILSKLPEDRVRDILDRSDRRPFTPETITDVPALMEKIAETREQGYSLAVGQILTGEIAVGFPVLDADGAPVAAIHVAGSQSEWTPADFTNRFVPLASEAARAISQY